MMGPLKRLDGPFTDCHRKLSDIMFNYFVSIWIKFFFLFTPFSALSMFLTMTHGFSMDQRKKLCNHVAGAVTAVCFILYFFGNSIFSVFGITLDAFRVGAGALLFLSAVGLVQTRKPTTDLTQDQDIAVVPLAIPIIVGPATIGTLLVMGVETTGSVQTALGCLALVTAILCVWIVLRLGSPIENVVGNKGINILSKVSGLVLAALAAQMILSGIRHYLS